MKRLAFASGLLVLSLVGATQAQADFAVVRFKSGYCRVWTRTAEGPQDFQYLAFRHGKRWHYRFATRAGAKHALHRAFATHRCHH